MLGDWGFFVHVVLRTDRSTAMGVTSRQGLGKLRHLDVRNLWLQQKLREKALDIKQVPSMENWSDMFTKPLDAATLGRMLEGLRYSVGRRGSERHRALEV